jgi:hypothetical protein
MDEIQLFSTGKPAGFSGLAPGFTGLWSAVVPGLKITEKGKIIKMTIF